MSYTHLKTGDPPTAESKCPSLQAVGPGDESWSHGTRRTRRRLRDAVGLLSASAILLGATVIAAATGILALLWEGAMKAAAGAEPPPTWQHIVDSGWVTRTVTICSAAIRMAMGAQIGVMTSMLASLLLERYTVALEHTALLSVGRALSLQPMSMLYFQARTLWDSSRLLVLPLLVVSVFVAAALPFLSTILLSDFALVNISGGTVSEMRAYAGTQADVALDVWRSMPAQYARFAEYTEAPTVDEHIDDTGLALRAFLPFASAVTRESMREYSGMAAVLDSRVTCVSPKTFAVYSLRQALLDGPARTNNSFVETFAVDGSVRFQRNQTGPLFDISDGTLGPDAETDADLVEFTCAITTNTHAPDIMPWNISVCSTPMSGSIVFRPFFGYADLIWFLVLNVTPPVGDWSSLSNEKGEATDVAENDTTTVRHGPWTTTSILGGKARGASVSVSACFSNGIGMGVNITAKSPRDGSEPSLAWKGEVVPATTSSATKNVSLVFYSSDNVRRQLGTLAAPADHDLVGRGVMALDYDATDWAGRDFPSILSEQPFSEALPVFQVTPLQQHGITSATALMALEVAPRLKQGHWAHVSLFYDSLAATKSPARAMQAWMTTLAQQMYYDRLPRSFIGAPAVYRVAAPVLIPVRWSGFGAVVAIMVAHLLVVWRYGTSASRSTPCWAMSGRPSASSLPRRRCPCSRSPRTSRTARWKGLSTSKRDSDTDAVLSGQEAPLARKYRSLEKSVDPPTH